MQLYGPGSGCQVPLPVPCRGVKPECGCRLDFLAEKAVVPEIRTVESFHDFNVPVMKDGIKRVVPDYKDFSAHSALLR